MMQNRRIISALVYIIAIFSVTATLSGILSSEGPGNYKFISVLGQDITIYGKGLYKNMSADVAIQGIAQDFVTLAAVPLLIFALFRTRKNSLKSKLFLAGILKYYFLTYLFYMSMGMYNEMFIVYVLLCSSSFFSLILVLLNIDIKNISEYFNAKTPVKYIGYFLVFLSLSIALLWLSIIIPPLVDGSIVPVAVQHYTTLIVQGFDLSIFLPIAFVGGLLLTKKARFGYLISSVVLVFLSFLMTALVAKIIAMAMADVNVIPAVIIIPVFLALSIIFAVVLYKNINENIKSSAKKRT